MCKHLPSTANVSFTKSLFSLLLQVEVVLVLFQLLTLLEEASIEWLEWRAHFVVYLVRLRWHSAFRLRMLSLNSTLCYCL